MKKIVGLLAAVLMALTMVVLPTGSANAYSGPFSGCSTRVETWQRNAWYTDFIVLTPVDMEVHLVGNSIYRFCYNGDNPNTLKPLKMNYCWTFISDRNFTADEFDGVKYNAYIWDDNEDTNPPTYTVDDNGNVQNCGTQILDYQPWLEMGQSPGWSLTAFIKVRLQPDTEAVFKVDGHAWRYYHPSEDLIIS